MMEIWLSFLTASISLFLIIKAKKCQTEKSKLGFTLDTLPFMTSSVTSSFDCSEVCDVTLDCQSLVYDAIKDLCHLYNSSDSSNRLVPKDMSVYMISLQHPCNREPKPQCLNGGKCIRGENHGEGWVCKCTAFFKGTDCGAQKRYGIFASNYPRKNWCGGNRNVQSRIDNKSKCSWVITPGLNEGGTVSLRPYALAASYLRKKIGTDKLYVEPLEMSAGFKLSASFYMTTDTDTETVQFESMEKRGHFIRHANSVLRLDPPGGGATYEEDRSFILVEN